MPNSVLIWVPTVCPDLSVRKQDYFGIYRLIYYKQSACIRKIFSDILGKGVKGLMDWKHCTHLTLNWEDPFSDLFQVISRACFMYV